jgi:hypothetical protein
MNRSLIGIFEKGIRIHSEQEESLIYTGRYFSIIVIKAVKSTGFVT